MVNDWENLFPLYYMADDSEARAVDRRLYLDEIDGKTRFVSATFAKIPYFAK